MKSTVYFIPVVLVTLTLNFKVTFGADCVDKYAGCEEWMKNDYCEKYANQMADNCCRTCKDAKALLEAKIEIALAKAEAKAAAEEAKASSNKASVKPTQGCSITTINGRCCVFPFKYKGKTYTECTTDSYPIPWCGTTADAKTWGVCQEHTTQPPKVTTNAAGAPPRVLSALLAAKEKPKGPCVKTKGGGCCHFPFVYKNSVHTNCITTPGLAKPWCGIDEYAKEWGECVNAVNGNWGAWFPFTHCSRSCGTGIKIRTRACDNPPASNGGAPCPGSPQENRYCNTQRCSDDGNWGPWSTYGECSVTCGMGLKTRTRKCDNPAPVNGGKKCAGPDKQDAVCQKGPCLDANKPAPQTQDSRTKQSVLGQPPPPGGAGSGTGANARLIPKLPTPNELRQQQQAGFRRNPSNKVSVQQMVREMKAIAQKAQDDRRSIDGTWGNHGVGPSNPDGSTGSTNMSPPVMNPDPIKNAQTDQDGTWGSAGIDPANPYQPQNDRRPPLGSLGSGGMTPGGAPPLGTLGSGGMTPGEAPPLGSLGSAGMNSGRRPPLGSLGPAGMNPVNPYRPQIGGRPPFGSLGSSGMNPGGVPPLGSLGPAGMNPVNPYQSQVGGRIPLGPLGSAGMNPGVLPPLGSLGSAGMNSGRRPPLGSLGPAGMNPVNPYQPQIGGRPPLGSLGSAGMNPGVLPPLGSFGSAGMSPGGVPPPLGSLGSAGMNPVNPYQPQNGGRPPLGSLGSAGMNPGGVPPLGSFGSAGMNPGGVPPPLGSLGSAGMNPVNPYQPQNGGRPPLGSLGSSGMNSVNQYQLQNVGRPPFGSLGSAGMNPLNPYQRPNSRRLPLGSFGSAGMNPLNPFQRPNGRRTPLGSLGSAGMNPINPYQLRNGRRPSLGSLRRAQVGSRRSTGVDPNSHRYVPQSH